MARPRIQNRQVIKTFRLTVKINSVLEARVKRAADVLFEGNFSTLTRVALEEFLTRFEASPAQSQEPMKQEA